MRSRRYSWRLRNLPKTFRVTVYADRSVELDIVHYDDVLRGGMPEITRRRAHLQTREEAAWMLRFARREYPIQKEWL